MKRQYECWECHHSFEAEDTEEVKCPQCGSDNVEIASHHINKRIWFLALAILAIIAVGLLGYWAYHRFCVPTQEEESLAEPIVIGNDTIITDYKGDQPPMLSMKDTPEFTEDGYKFKMNVQYPPQGEFKFVLLNAFDDKVIAESNNGDFEKIPFSTAEGGSYRVVLRATDGTDLSEAVPVIGFIKQKKVTTKMTVKQIQTLIDKNDNSLMGVGENDWLSPEVELSFTGLPSDVINVPTILAEVIEKLMMGDWKAAAVKKLEYDDMNRIKKIYIHVTPNNAF